MLERNRWLSNVIPSEVAASRFDRQTKAKAWKEVISRIVDMIQSGVCFLVAGVGKGRIRKTKMPT